jgi:RimJ/RimL family protein N-acetyltransferase
MPTLKGTTVQLRAISKKDIPVIVNWFNDPEVIQYLRFYLPLTEIAEEKYIEEASVSGDSVLLVIEAILDNGETRPIGTCGLHRIDWKDRNATFGIAIGEKEFWSGGRGTEAARLMISYAFDQLNLHRVSSAAYSFNERSIKMHRKLGFTIEGQRRQCVYKNGSYHDDVIFGLLRDEWTA